MHGFILNVLLSYSILIPAAVGIVRFTSITQDFYPFILLIWLGLVNETVSIILAYTIKSNVVNSNIYVLLEYFLILVQFYKWNGPRNSRLYYFFALTGLSVWIADNVVINTVTENNSIFRIFYSSVITFFSIALINKVFVRERNSLIKNAMFLICSTFFIYYSCKAFVEVFNAFHLGLSKQFNRYVFMILYLANSFSNIIYAIAILCIPRKQKFTQPF